MSSPPPPPSALYIHLTFLPLLFSSLFPTYLAGPFTEDDEQIMKTLCIQTSITLRNSQMYTSSLLAQHKIKVLLEVAQQLSSGK